MGSLQIWQRNNPVSFSFSFIFFLFLFIFIHVISSIQGRGTEAPLMEGIQAEGQSGSPEQSGMMMGSQIGSRPPICRRRCRECGGHCEAVQVPVGLHDAHQNQRKRRSSQGYSINHDVALSSEDETSNYKPISWKCKCGNFIFNP